MAWYASFRSRPAQAAPAGPIVNVTPPAWPGGGITDGQQAIFDGGTWSGPISDVREWVILLNDPNSPEVNFSYTGAPPNTETKHTPKVPPAAIGDTLYIKASVFDAVTGQRYTAVSAGAVIQAAVQPFTATVALPSVSITEDQAVSVTPVVFSGGVQPYSISAPLPSDLTINGNTALITGQANNPQGSTPITVSGTDALGAPASGVFNLIVNAASGATPLPALPLPTLANYSTDLNTTPNFTGANLVDSAGEIHIGLQSDPMGSGAVVRRHRVRGSTTFVPAGPGNNPPAHYAYSSRYPPFFTDPAYRSELLYGSTGGRVPYSVHNGIAFAVWFDPVEAITVGPVGVNNDICIFFQTHTPYSGGTTPSLSIAYAGQPIVGALSGRMEFRIAGGRNPASGGGQLTTDDYTLTSPGLPATGQWHCFILDWFPGFNPTMTPFTQMWWSPNGPNGTYTAMIPSAETSRVNCYNNAPNGTGSNDYMRQGQYKSSYWRGDGANLALSMCQTPLFYAVCNDSADVLARGRQTLINYLPGL